MPSVPRETTRCRTSRWWGAFRPMVRIATKHDRRVLERNRREKEAFDVCQKKILQHKLEMKAGAGRVKPFLATKILFLHRRWPGGLQKELVKGLASASGPAIELRQIGVRDGHKRCWAAWGSAAGPSCCAPVLDDFMPRSPSRWPRPRAYL